MLLERRQPDGFPLFLHQGGPRAHRLEPSQKQDALAAVLHPRERLICWCAVDCAGSGRGALVTPVSDVKIQDLTPNPLLVHSDNDVVESAWRVDAGFAWHAVSIAEHDRVGKL